MHAWSALCVGQDPDLCGDIELHATLEELWLLYLDLKIREREPAVGRQPDPAVGERVGREVPVAELHVRALRKSRTGCGEPTGHPGAIQRQRGRALND